ncbi:MAG: metallophosphoesterase [Planctomycetota bacterium]|nr:metallophosphoesterase [Planctomycetota bacterium]
MSIPRLRVLAVWIAVVVPVFFSFGCQAPNLGLVGFHDSGSENPKIAASEVVQDLVTIESEIRKDWPQTSDDSEVVNLMSAVLESLLSVKVALGNERPDFMNPNQQFDPGRPPLLIYPRLTSPAIVEAILTAPANVKATEVRPALSWPGGEAWIIPAILSTRTPYWDSDRVYNGFSWSQMGTPGPSDEDRDNEAHLDVDFTGLLDHLAIILEKHSPKDLAARNPRIINDASIFRVSSTDIGQTVPGRKPFAIVLSTAKYPSGFFRLRLLPKLDLDGASEGENHLLGLLRSGDWYGFWKALSPICSAEHSEHVLTPSLLDSIADASEKFSLHYFREELSRIAEECRELSERGTDAMTGIGVSRLELAIRAFLMEDASPAPVLLDSDSLISIRSERKEDEEDEFYVALAADVQYGGDLTALRTFLSLMDTSMLPKGVSEPYLNPEFEKQLRRTKFVIIAGDLADGSGLSSSLAKPVISVLGLLPPTSPYEDEYREIRKELMSFDRPVFAVPGNHDGFVATSGLLDWAPRLIGNMLSGIGLSLNRYTRNVVGHPFRALGWTLRSTATYILPTVKFGYWADPTPLFDGLVEWHTRLGPLNTAFRYRGQSFVGLNSYNLHYYERDSVGPLAQNWGGGITPRDAFWFRVVTQWHALKLKGGKSKGSTQSQIVFMHHDPRGALITPHTFEERKFARYDSVDSYGNALTFGLFGNSPNFPVFIPIWTPLVTYLPRVARYGDEFNQEWMGPHLWFDRDYHGAEHLVPAITDNLHGDGTSGISHVFFGHNDVPHKSNWIHHEDGGRVFRRDAGEEWPSTEWGSCWRYFMAIWFKMRTQAPPEWGIDLRRPKPYNAEVYRCDDIGQSSSSHGFYLLTFGRGSEGIMCLKTVELIPIPQ